MTACARCTLENDSGAAACAACGASLETDTSRSARPPSKSKGSTATAGQRSILEALGAAPKELGQCSQLPVPGLPGEWVRTHAIGREVRSWSKVYVPLIYVALGEVPAAAAAALAPKLSARQAVATARQLERASAWWAARFSCWPRWVRAVRGVVRAEGGAAAFAERFVCTPAPRGKTALVFGDGAGFGWLPHLHARNQERTMEAAAIDGEIALCVGVSTAP